MTERPCYCGLRSIKVEHASYHVNGAACCTRQCYNNAVAAAQPFDKDGFMWGGPPEPAAKRSH